MACLLLPIHVGQILAYVPIEEIFRYGQMIEMRPDADPDLPWTI
jgi:hypothetical protein